MKRKRGKVVWKKTRVPDNRGRAMDQWAWGDYTIAENINRGTHWAFEVVYRRSYIGEGLTLEEAQSVAVEHYIDQE